jgi:hypothetical protein
MYQDWTPVVLRKDKPAVKKPQFANNTSVGKVLNKLKIINFKNGCCSYLNFLFRSFFVWRLAEMYFVGIS